MEMILSHRHKETMTVDENIPIDGKETAEKAAHILEDFWCRLHAVSAGYMLVGALLPSDKYINDHIISLDIGYNVLTKLPVCIKGHTYDEV